MRVHRSIASALSLTLSFSLGHVHDHSTRWLRGLAYAPVGAWMAFFPAFQCQFFLFGEERVWPRLKVTAVTIAAMVVTSCVLSAIPGCGFVLYSFGAAQVVLLSFVMWARVVRGSTKADADALAGGGNATILGIGSALFVCWSYAKLLAVNEWVAGIYLTLCIFGMDTALPMAIRYM